MYCCSYENFSEFITSDVLRRIFVLSVDVFLIDGYYPMNITEKLSDGSIVKVSDEAIVKAQCFYYKQLLLMIRFC